MGRVGLDGSGDVQRGLGVGVGQLLLTRGAEQHHFMEEKMLGLVGGTGERAEIRGAADLD